MVFLGIPARDCSWYSRAEPSLPPPDSVFDVDGDGALNIDADLKPLCKPEKVNRSWLGLSSLLPAAVSQ